jgi:hypothetical protein
METRTIVRKVTKSLDVNLSVSDDIKKLADLSKQNFEKVFAKVIAIGSEIDNALSIGNKSLSDSKKGYEQGLKLEQQAKELGIDLPGDVKNAIKVLYQNSELEGQQILKDLAAAKKAIA